MKQSDAIAIFRLVLDSWPKQENAFQAKATMVKMLMTDVVGEDDIISASRNYLFFTDPAFCKTLLYWLRDDDWKSWVTLNDKLKDRMTASIVFVSLWNKNRKPFWPEVQNSARCKRLFCDACQDKFFYDNWRKGIDKISKWTKAPKYAALTMQWFTDRDKCTLERILEGSYNLSYEDECYSYASLQEIRRANSFSISEDERKRAFKALLKLNCKK